MKAYNISFFIAMWQNLLGTLCFFSFFWNTNSYQCYSFVGFLVERSPLETEKTDFGRGGSFVLGALAMPK